MKRAVLWLFSRLMNVLVFLVAVVAAYEVERRYSDTKIYEQVRKYIGSLIGGESAIGFEEIWMWSIAIFANLALVALVGTASVLIFGKVERFFQDKHRLRQEQRESLLNDIEQAYLLLRMVCEPETLDPQHPGNPGFMKVQARDFVNPMIPRLEEAGLSPPSQCTKEDNSLQEWFKYFGDLRIRIAKK